MEASIQTDRLKLEKKLAGMSNDSMKVISNLIKAGSLNISTNAKKRVAKGPKTGGLYEWEAALPGEQGAVVDATTGKLFFVLGFPIKIRSKPHRASAPGESPASDTGGLLNSIIARSQELSSEVGSVRKYAPWLEFGTDSIEPRPFLQPAIDEEWPKTQAAVIDTIGKLF